MRKQNQHGGERKGEKKKRKEKEKKSSQVGGSARWSWSVKKKIRGVWLNVRRRLKTAWDCCCVCVMMMRVAGT